MLLSHKTRPSGATVLQELGFVVEFVVHDEILFRIFPCSYAIVYIEKKVSKYSERQIHHFQHNEVNLKKFNEIK